MFPTFTEIEQLTMRVKGFARRPLMLLGPTVLISALLSAPAFSVTPAVGSEASTAIGKAEFIDSLTDAERKVPLSAVLTQRMARGQPLPTSALTRVAAQSTTDSSDGRVYKITGMEATAVASWVRSLGIEPIHVSDRRPYITAYLTIDQLFAVASSPDVLHIREFASPQPQGFFEVYDAHVGGQPPEAWTAANLTGDGVVVAIISAPLISNELAALDAEFVLAEGGAPTRVIPATNNLKQWPGVVNDTYGSSDLLALMQVVYRFAPGATFVIASPYTEYTDVGGNPIGVSSTPDQMASLIAQLVDGDPVNNIPAANIIIDDLFYPAQNPFEFDEVTEAVMNARYSGTLYITAAGDHGHLDPSGANTSTTHLSVVDIVNPNTQVESNPLWAVHNNGSLGGNVHAFANQQGDNVGFLELAQNLSDLCLFWDQKPAPNNAFDDPFVYIYSSANAELEWWAPSGPGECLNGGSYEGSGLPADAKVVLEWWGSAEATLLIQGLGVEPGTAAFKQDGGTVGGMRGHSRSPDAITVSAVSVCMDGSDPPAILPYSDAACSDPAVATFSSDGQGLYQFPWQFDSISSTWVEGPAFATDSDRSYRKPNVAALGMGTVVTPGEGGSAGEAAYSGTSYAAAAVAGMAALYWQHRDDVWDQAPGLTPEAIQARRALVHQEVRAALRDAAQGDPVSPFDLTESLLVGDGVVEAPLAISNDLFAQPLWVNGLSVEVGVEAMELTFLESEDDGFDGDFKYWVECEGLDLDADSAASEGLYVWPENSANSSGFLGHDKAPVIINAAVESTRCSVTPIKNALDAELWSPSILTTNPIFPIVASAPTVVMESKVMGVSLSVSDPSNYPANTTVNHAISCEVRRGDALFSESSVSLPFIYSMPLAQGTVDCSVTTTVQWKTATARVLTSSASADVLSVSAPSLVMTADSGGVLLRWTANTNLLDGASEEFTITCTQGSVTLLSNFVPPSGSTGYFVNASADAPVSCRVAATVTHPDLGDVTRTSPLVSATPDEELLPGLPIWLLYQMTQP